LPGVTDDCRRVAFTSNANDIVAQDTTFTSDIFVRDRVTGGVELISVNTAGEPGFPSSGGFLKPPAMSQDGRFVAFDSYARNLVPGDTNESTDVFLRDRLARTTVRVSVSSSGEQAESASAVEGMSADGRYILFSSRARNLVADDTNGTATDVFIHDGSTRTTTLVSRKHDGTQVTEDSLAYDLSNDGRFVAFESRGTYTSGDTNNALDAFVKDLRTGAVERVSVSNSEKQFGSGGSAPSMSADGNLVAFSGGPANTLPQVYVRNRAAKATALVSANIHGKPGNRSSFAASISANGRYVAFGTGADEMAPGPGTDFFDLYVRDLRTKTTVMASITSSGTPIQQSTGFGAMCDTGVAFYSAYPMVMPDSDTNQQIYFRSL
jgi:Tol biopolymer transport system component